MTYLLFLVPAVLFVAVSYFVYHIYKADKMQEQIASAASVSTPTLPENDHAYRTLTTSMKTEDQPSTTKVINWVGGTRPNILVVDDQQPIRMLLTELFLGAGCDVYEAKNGHIALDLFEANRVDCILLDLKMPDMDGLEVLRSIRKINSAVPVILISAYVEPAIVDEASKLGIDKRLSKPFDIEELRDEVLRLVGKSD